MEGAPETRALASLSVDEVCRVLSKLGLGRYAAAFRALPVNGATLAAVDNADNLREVGVEVAIHRKMLLRRVAELREGGVPRELLVSVPGSVDLQGFPTGVAAARRVAFLDHFEPMKDMLQRAVLSNEFPRDVRCTCIETTSGRYKERNRV